MMCTLATLSLAATLIWVLPEAAWARISKKRDQVELRYGKPVGEWNDTRYAGIHYCMYHHDGFSIQVLYILGTSYAESYARMPATTLITRDELNVLLDANRCGLSWLSAPQIAEMMDGNSERSQWIVATTDLLLFDRNKRTGPFAQAHEENYEDAPGHKSLGRQYTIESWSIWDYKRDYDAAKAKADLKKF